MTALEDPVAHYLRDIASKPALNREQELALFTRANRGDSTAYQEVIESHLKMVVFIARHHHSPLPLADRIEEGNLGMMHAVQKFDPAYGCRFATYALWWVRAYITRAITNQSCIVRVPVHIRQALNTVRRTELALTIEYNRPPTVIEIAHQMETKVSRVQSLLYLAQPQVQVEEDNDASMDTVRDDYSQVQSPSPEQQLEQKQNIVTIAHWLESLKARECRVICSRFGLQGFDEMTLEAIGQELHCSKERVRQIQVAALQKLRQYIANKQEKGLPYDITPYI